ncbi:MAG: hypothetical protein GX994_06445, partial [Firmicutes bacterium]|nr:hypothetical protein [Bacillota bacterium]
MKRVRVYELARELELESKELVSFLIDLGADIKNHMSTIDLDIAEMVKEHFLGLSIDEEMEEEVNKQRHKKQKKKLDDDEELDDIKITEKISKDTIPKNKKKQVKDSKSKHGKDQTEIETLELPEVVTLKELAVKIGVS